MREKRDMTADPAAAAHKATPDKRGTTILRDTGRVEAFSDGVFAVAATLLVLNLQPPDLKGNTLLSQLLLMGPKLVVYAISFGFILIMWINHHNMLRLIRGTDHNFLLLNGLLLLLVTLVPFTTALLFRYPASDQSTAAAVYSANYFLIALAFNFVWWYATWHGRLLNVNVDMGAVRTTNRRYRLGPLYYLICVALAFVSVPLSLAANTTLAVFFAWPHSIHTSEDLLGTRHLSGG